MSILSRIAFLIFTLSVAGAIGFLFLLSYYSKDLPGYEQLKNYYPATVTRLYSGDGRMIAEYATQRRVFVPIKAIPKRLVEAFIAAEDQNFYRHSGVDLTSILRAVIFNVSKLRGNNVSGGSTITQQVVKNFLLSNERTLSRKIREAILSLRISKAIPKDRILELYLNQIYLGRGSYGVAAASLNYFNKSVDELTVEEAAYLAALPKAPADYDPARNYERAKDRRDWVIKRMLEEHYITENEAAKAAKEPLKLQEAQKSDTFTSNYFAEEVRRELLKAYGSKELYEGGMAVHTTLDPKLQGMAERALFEGLIEYDRRHGYRGPIARIRDLKSWKDELAKITPPPALGPWKLAAVLKVSGSVANIGLTDGTMSFIPFEEVKWARKNVRGQLLGASPSRIAEILSAGDVVAVAPKGDKSYSLKQIPDVNGAIIAMDPHSGRVLAMVGGYPYGGSEFNRAIQAKRQPGSAFKTFVYMAALENNFTPATIVLDSPVELPQGPGMPNWKPKNYSGDFLGAIPLRKGLEKSRNAVTIRISLMLGLDKVIEMATRFGIVDNPPAHFAMVLGALETTLLQITNGYGMIDNGGKATNPAFIEYIQDRNGKVIYRRDSRKCEACGDSPSMPVVPDSRERIIDAATAYQATSLLEGVVKRGTATKALALGKPVAGKTGTTNDSFDTWFIGFSPDLVVGTFVGFDTPRTLGPKETGGSVALPVFVRFMKEALAGKPAKPFPVPEGVVFQKVDASTGQAPDEFTDPHNIVTEVFNASSTGKINYSDEYKNIQGEEGEYEEEGGYRIEDTPRRHNFTNGTGGVY